MGGWRRQRLVVCSDEPRQMDEFPGLSVGFGPGSSVGDLYALAKCDYLIGVSTFSQWASLYGDKPFFHLYDRNVRLDLNAFRVSDLELIP